MNSDWIGIAALVAVHLGFAALLGAFAGRAKDLSSSSASFLAALAYFGSSLSLPLALLPKAGLALASAGLFAYFGRRGIPGAWQARLAWLYAGFSMLLILLWSAAQGWFSPLASLGAAAGWAGVLAWRRGFTAG
ncbi:MAG: hypothetical protein KIT46_00970 [Anaerolineales bacterium]|nr:hypothetical protein [Anaerolineales bacterium]MCW5854595.1 hypothetical protein [Anaerolineales bacterium]